MSSAESLDERIERLREVVLGENGPSARVEQEINRFIYFPLGPVVLVDDPTT
jgi:hypothetical protein